ncbi:hypothetical protein [Aquisphaera insulae]|uniref:hypothetical protein n=1 Tax=Aquisphaera insulae TaxID=2712864 RepID=UPI0013ED7D6C|nr:hypothetical protein [Aquisphaera insulae]
MYTVYAHLTYLFLSVATTIWVARTLARNGRVFLSDTFGHNEALADAVNNLLVVGFYLINVGYVALALRYGTQPHDLAESIEVISTKVGLVLLVLGGMHFFNLYVFARMRRKALLRSQKPPVSPEQFVTPVGTWAAE